MNDYAIRPCPLCGKHCVGAYSLCLHVWGHLHQRLKGKSLKEKVGPPYNCLCWCGVGLADTNLAAHWAGHGGVAAHLLDILMTDEGQQSLAHAVYKLESPF